MNAGYVSSVSSALTVFVEGQSEKIMTHLQIFKRKRKRIFVNSFYTEISYLGKMQMSKFSLLLYNTSQ